MSRRLIKAVVAFALIVSLLCGCSAVKPMDYTCQELTITVSSDMRDVTSQFPEQGYDFALSSNSIAVFGLREAFEMFEDNAEGITLEQYASMVISANGISSELVMEGDLPTFTFTSMVDGVEYAYIAAVYASDNAFWLLQASCMSTNYTALKGQMLEYLKTVKIA